MNDALYSVRGRLYREGDQGLQAALAAVYESPERPRCMCTPGGVDMCVAKYDGYIVRRMPQTGRMHHPSCPSFEPEPGTSGRGPLLGEAIIARGDAHLELRVGFSLERSVPPRASTRLASESGPPGTVAAARRRMSLRAVLHEIYQRAELNRWHPRMEGLRNHGVFEKYMMLGAQDCWVRGELLTELMYVPPPALPGEREAAAARRRERLAKMLGAGEGGSMKKALIVGEYYRSESTPYGQKVLIKNMLDAPLYIDAKAWAKAERAYEPLFLALDADVKHKPRLIVMALTYERQPHQHQIEQLTTMLVTSRWIPLNDMVEHDLIERLVDEGRAFVKPLLYDERSALPYASALLVDTGGTPIELHLSSPHDGEKARESKLKLTSAKPQSTWLWSTEDPMPALPPAAAARPAATQSRLARGPAEPPAHVPSSPASQVDLLGEATP